MMECPRINIIYVIFIVEEFIVLHVIVNDIVCHMNYRLKLHASTWDFYGSSFNFMIYCVTLVEELLVYGGCITDGCA